MRILENKWVTVSFVILPMLAQLLVVAFYTTNYPFLDDYVTTLDFLNRYYEANSFGGKLEAILAQWSEHRIGFGKAMTLLYQKVFGSVNFVALSLLANASLVLFYWLLMKEVDKKLRKYVYVPSALLLFQLQYYIAQHWLVSSSSFFYVLLFAILSLHFFRRGKWYWAAFFGFVAIYCNANGILVLLGEALCLVLQSRFKRAIAFVVVLLVGLWGYLIGYVPHENDKLSTFYYLEYPWPTIDYFLVFLGAPFNIVNGMGRVMGVLGVVLFCYLTYRKYYVQNPSVYILLFLILGTSALAALGRSFWGVEQALESRYKIFSAVFWICSLIAWVEGDKSQLLKKVYPLALLFCFCFCIGAYYTSWEYMLRFKARKQAQFEDIYQYKPIVAMTDAREILRKSISNGFYNAPLNIEGLRK
jgi:hypothetical protein